MRYYKANMRIKEVLGKYSPDQVIVPVPTDIADAGCEVRESREEIKLCHHEKSHRRLRISDKSKQKWAFDKYDCCVL